MNIELRRAPCGHAWVDGIEPELHDGMKEIVPIRVRDNLGGSCPICAYAGEEETGD